MTETSEASDLPAKRRDGSSVLLKRQDSLDSVKSELAAKRGQRNLIRVLVGGVSGAKMVTELVQGADPVETIILTVVVLAVFLIPIELSWRPVIARLEGVESSLKDEVDRLPARQDDDRLSPGAGA